MAPRVYLIIVLMLQTVFSEEVYKAKDGLMDRLSSSMKFAKDFLGSESVALKVAEFVVRAFQTANTPKSSTNRRNPYSPTSNDYKDEPAENEDHQPYKDKLHSNVNEANPMAPLRQLVKLFGLQPTQISAVAVNALLFVAQMISSFLSGPRRPSRLNRSDDPLSWILNKRSQKLQDLLTTAKNESLSNIIEDIIEDQNSNEDISCVKLLVCKITPFVSKMQKTVFGGENEKSQRASVSAMYRHLPTEDEINQRSDICEQKHKDCDLNK